MSAAAETLSMISITRTEPDYTLHVQGDGPWHVSLAFLVRADPQEPIRVYVSDGGTYMDIAGEQFEVTGFAAGEGSIILTRQP